MNKIKRALYRIGICSKECPHCKKEMAKTKNYYWCTNCCTEIRLKPEKIEHQYKYQTTTGFPEMKMPKRWKK